jgi:hypothetical protein
MDAIDKYEELKQIITAGARLMGINIMDFNYKPNLRTLATSTILVMVNSTMIFSFFRGAPKVMMMLRALTISGLAVACTYKFIFIFWFREDFYNIVQRVDKLYEENVKLGQHRTKKLINCMNICRFFQRFFMLLYGSSIFLFLAFPAYSFVFKGELVLPVDIFLPMVDETTTIGYFGTLFWHLVMLVMALIGITSFDISFMTWSVRSVFLRAKLINDSFLQDLSLRCLR